ncbi:flagellin [Comamonas sp.]|uniref:flagellin N-terminal helical domain-containing protein n=1 Tax=Comamonas sp. TaxID=34028 RepID=UPI003A8F5E2E
MAMTINTNIQSLNAQRNLGASQSSLSTSMQRLSSGMRINSAKDDAAGLAIAERMSAQVKGLNQAARNANDGVSLAQTAEGALSTIGGNLQRIRELAVQSRNATNSSEDRGALQKEVEQLKSEIDRVATTTSFNGTNLLDGTFTAKAFQVGANQGQRINIAQIQDANIDQLGSWTSATKPASAFGTALSSASQAAGATTLTVGKPANPAAAEAAVADFKLKIGNVELDVKGLASVGAGARDEDAAQAALAANIASAINGSAELAGKGITATVGATGVDVTNASVTASAVEYAGAPANYTLGAAPIAKGTGAVAAGDFTINGKKIELTESYTTADRMDQLKQKIGAAFADGSVSAEVVNGSLVLRSESKIDVADGTGTAANMAGVAAKAYDVTAGSTQTGFTNASVATAEEADNTILAMDAALKAVNSARADLGAIQNRFESVVSNLNVNSENLSASKSRIMDADFASETANLSRSQILQQAGTAMVAQANQLPQGVLSLLR